MLPSVLVEIKGSKLANANLIPLVTTLFRRVKTNGNVVPNSKGLGSRFVQAQVWIAGNRNATHPVTDTTAPDPRFAPISGDPKGESS